MGPPFPRQLTRRSAQGLPEGFDSNGKGNRIGNACAFDRSLEALAFHRSFWPVIMELTNGKPKMKHNVLLRDDWSGELGYAAGGGGHLHCAKEDWGVESAEFMARDGPHGGTLYATAPLVFVSLLRGNHNVNMVPFIQSKSFNLPLFLVHSYRHISRSRYLTDVNPGDGGLLSKHHTCLQPFAVVYGAI